MTYSSRVAEHRNILKNIEASEKAKVKILPPLKPMIDTLNQFIEKEQAEQLTSFSDLKDKIGGSESQYYHACYAIAQTMLLEEDDKQRCVIFNGLSGSGKTVIASFMHHIFDSHFENETKSLYNEKITREEAH